MQIVRPLSREDFYATLREPIRNLPRTPTVQARIAPLLPAAAKILGVAESFDGMFIHVLVPDITGACINVVIDNASGMVRGGFPLDFSGPAPHGD